MNDKLQYPRPMTVYSRPRHAASSIDLNLPSYDAWRQEEEAKLISRTKERSGSRRRMGPFRAFAAIYGDSMGEDDGLAEVEDQTVTYPTGFKWFLLLLSGAMPYIVVVLDDTIIATIIPLLITEFREPGDIGWYASAYFLPLTVLMPVFGKCYSLWKIKWLFSSSLAVLLIGSILSATAVTSSMFIAGRATAGVGAAGIINGAMRIIGISSPRQQRTFLEAAGALVMGGCTVAGPILGGLIADNFGWRWAFWLNVPIALGALAVVLFIFPPETPRTTLFGLSSVEKIKRLDPIGTVALVGGLSCLITSLQSQATAVTFTQSDRNLVIATVACLAVFTVHEIFVKAEIALIPRRIFRQRAVWSCCVTLFFLFAGFIDFVFFLSIFFQSVNGESAQASAVSLLPYVIAVSVAAVAVGVLVSWVHYYNPFFMFGGIAFAVGGGLIYTFDDKTTFMTRAIFEAVLGAGAGFITLANVAPCHIQLDEKDHSVANGLLFLCSLLGSTIALPIASTLFNRKFLSGVLNLDIPPELKLTVLSDPSKIRYAVPDDLLPVVIATTIAAIRTAFIFGLCCAIACALSTVLVPFKRLISRQQTDTAKGSRASHSEDNELVRHMRRASAGSALASVWIRQT